MKNTKKNKKKNSQKGDRNTGQSRQQRPDKNPRQPSITPPALYGFHAVREAWCNPERNVQALYITAEALDGFQEALHDTAAKGLNRPHPTIMDKGAINKACPRGAVHQGIALACGPLPEITAMDLAIKARDRDNALVVMLDQVTDPHNVGAILRSAAAFGALGVVMQSRHAPELESALAKTACGAVEHIPVAHETNLSRALEDLKEAGFFVYGLDEHSEQSISDMKPGGKVVLVLGAEGSGMRRLVSENCDAVLKLPTGGPIASLNVSNAAAVALYALCGRV